MKTADSTFAELGLARALCQVLQGQAYQAPTPIQALAIPAVLAGEDVLGIAQTGTGKTVAYCVPVLQRLHKAAASRESRRPGALVLSPTRELAMQIYGEVEKYAAAASVTYACITGGVNQKRQERVLRKGIDVLVATPGRLLDLEQQGHIDLSGVQHFVLDEADQLLDMGFVRDVRKITAKLPRKRQTMLFSATMSGDIEKLAAEILRKPVALRVRPEEVTVEKIDQHVVNVTQKSKTQALKQLLAEPALRKAIVFTRTKHGASRLGKKLEKQGLGVEVIHGNKSQNARIRALANFTSGQAWILVATDVAARGIDIPEISHVINFDLPHEPEVYVHRVGRTARAGARGVAWSLVDPSEVGRLKAIERLTKIRPKVLTLDLEEEETQSPVSSERRSELAGETKKRVRRKRSRRRSGGRISEQVA